MNAKTLPPAHVVARAFSTALADELTPDDLRQAIMRNRFESSADVCHTHDFCDANIVMYQALFALGVEALPADAPEMPDDVIALWNDAWEIAKRAEFDPERIGDPAPALAFLQRNDGAVLVWQVADPSAWFALAAQGSIVFDAENDLFVHPAAVAVDGGGYTLSQHQPNPTKGAP